MSHRGANDTYGHGRTSPGHAPNVTQVTWRKSSHSSYNGACIEVAGLPSGMTGVRDSKDVSSGRILAFGPAAWSEFVAAVKNDGLSPSS